MKTSDSQISKGYYIFLMILLGLLCGFGTFVTDMYLPTLPSMTKVFNTTPSMVQLGLTTSMLGLAVGQLFFGPISDRYGRKKVLVSTLVLFSIATELFSPLQSIYSTHADLYRDLEEQEQSSSQDP